MEFIGKELFPLVKFLVVNQTRKFNIILDSIIVMNISTGPTARAGYYDHEKRTICLNIKELDNPEIILRFGMDVLPWESKEEQKTRLGAAVLFEECYHAAHHGTELNTEELATAYGKKQASKLPTEILTKEPKVDTTTQALQERLVLSLTSGGMFNFINEISRKGEMNTVVPTRYGSMEIINNEHVTSVKHTTNISNLNAVKDVLGHITRVGIEYAGMIYVNEEGKWKTLVDVDDTRMAETDIEKVTEIHLTKIEGQNPLIELRR